MAGLAGGRRGFFQGRIDALCAGLSGLTGLTFTKLAWVSLSLLEAQGGLALQTGWLRNLGLRGDLGGNGCSESGKEADLSDESPLTSAVSISPVHATYTDEKTESG